MQNDLLMMAKAHLSYVQSKRAAEGGEPKCERMMEEAQLAISIAQVEATERLTEALAGAPWPEEFLPFQELRVRCVHGAYMGDACETCDALIGDKDISDLEQRVMAGG